MGWTGHEISHEIKSIHEINWSKDIKSFQDALKNYGVPGQNIMYADKSDNIAMFSVAKLPIRKHDPLLYDRVGTKTMIGNLGYHLMNYLQL